MGWFSKKKDNSQSILPMTNQSSSPKNSMFSRSSDSSKSSLKENLLKVPGAGAVVGEEEDLTDRVCQCCCPNLSFKQRVTGWAICFIAGYVINFFSSFFLITNNIDGYAVTYSVGTLISIAGGFFLSGPKKQAKTMFAKTRRYTAIFYLLCIVAVLVVALTIGNIGLVLILMVLQCLVATWFSLSQIPYGRTFAAKAISKISCCAPVGALLLKIS